MPLLLHMGALRAVGVGAKSYWRTETSWRKKFFWLRATFAGNFLRMTRGVE